MTKTKIEKTLLVLLLIFVLLSSIFIPISLIDYYKQKNNSFIFTDCQIYVNAWYKIENETNYNYYLENITTITDESSNFTYTIKTVNCQLVNYTIFVLIHKDNFSYIIQTYDVYLNYQNITEWFLYFDFNFNNVFNPFYYIQSQLMFEPTFSVIFKNRRI